MLVPQIQQQQTVDNNQSKKQFYALFWNFFVINKSNKGKQIEKQNDSTTSNSNVKNKPKQQQPTSIPTSTSISTMTLSQLCVRSMHLIASSLARCGKISFVIIIIEFVFEIECNDTSKFSDVEFDIELCCS